MVGACFDVVCVFVLFFVFIVFFFCDFALRFLLASCSHTPTQIHKQRPAHGLCIVLHRVASSPYLRSLRCIVVKAVNVAVAVAVAVVPFLCTQRIQHYHHDTT